MGQRFHAIFTCETNQLHPDGSVETFQERTARTLGWCWGMDAVVRAAQSVAFADALCRTPVRARISRDVLAGLFTSFCINQATGNVQGLYGFNSASVELDEVGTGLLDNDNGMFLLNFRINEYGLKTPDSFTFGFTVGHAFGGDNSTLVSVEEFVATCTSERDAWLGNERLRVPATAALEVLRQAEAGGCLMNQAVADHVMAADPRGRAFAGF